MPGKKQTMGAVLGDWLRPKTVTEVEKADLLGRTKADRLEWIKANLFIRDKNRQIIPLRPNGIQQKYLDTQTLRDIILKYRQGGISTWTLAEFFEDTINTPNTVTWIIAHDLELTKKLFKIIQLFFKQLPDSEKARISVNPKKPGRANSREYYFDRINSSIYVGTAGSRTAGRGDTINNLLCSEFAFWKKADEVMMGLLEAVPMDGRVVIESTANGLGGEYYDTYQRAKGGTSNFKAHFYPWFIHEEYQRPLDPGEVVEFTEEEQRLADLALKLDITLIPEQIKWRRDKIRDKKGLRNFRQEYPEDDATCFLTSGALVFDGDALGDQVRICPAPIEMRDNETLRIWKRPVAGRKYILSADVAEGGADGDADAAYMIDHLTGEDVAALYGRWPPHVYGQKLCALGREYNNALLVPERNNHGHSVLNTVMHQEHYPNVYMHQDYDQTGRPKERKPGWPTNLKTKPVAVDLLDSILREGDIPFNDQEFFTEALAFVHLPDGGMGAQAGAHDDRVMARAIGLAVRHTPGAQSAMLDHLRAKMDSCPACSKIVTKTAKQCHHCGAALSLCGSCGAVRIPQKPCGACEAP